MENLIKSILVLIGFTVIGCVPQFESVGGDIKSLDSASLESHLSTTSTGSQSLQDLNSLRQQGYSISYLSVGNDTIQSINGHSGGGYKINGSVITIYINNSLASHEQAHIIAHELVHIKDDLDIDLYLRSYSYISAAAQSFVSTYKTNGIDSFDQKVVSYVLGTLFCTEARAYNRNQQLYNEGLHTDYFAKGTSMAQFIDNNYIEKFGVNYGSTANSMASWCLSQNSMNQIQSKLVW